MREEAVDDDRDDEVAQLTLGGLTVRAGHGAILTELECAFGILTPVDELVDRAMAHEDGHVEWEFAVAALAHRRDIETFLAVTAHRHDPDPRRRWFVLDVFRFLPDAALPEHLAAAAHPVREGDRGRPRGLGHGRR
ncbi:hypothetical protein ACFW6F_10100 [Streptomyces sp. NPDC058746]|uniref:hypothetical protein n=1 Tax=Streptomyces sp. NPDC058746 TaxID=3346622 RepID=UPI0036934BAD